MRVRTRVLVFLPAVIVLGCWQLFVRLSPQAEFFLGSPLRIVREIGVLWSAGNLINDVFGTAGEALTGFVAGSFLGTVLGLSLWYSRVVYAMAKPYIIALGSIPVFALGPMLIFWFGTGFISKAVLAFL